MLSKLSYLNSNIALTLGYLNPALKNTALLVNLPLHAYFEKRSLDFHQLEKGRLPKPFLRVSLTFARPLSRQGWNFVSFDQDKCLIKLSLLLKMLLNAFYKYVPEWGGRYGKRRATSCQCRYTVDQRLKTKFFLLNRVNCSLSFLLFICVSKGKYVDRDYIIY